MKFSPSQRINEDSREFALYTLNNRAIPTVTDGLKPVQRIILWLIRNAPKNKTFALVGKVMESKLYVHGDASVDDAIGKLAAPYNNNIPLVEGIGAFGTRVAPVEGIGAARYTSVQPAKFADAALYGDIDILPMAKNYDGSAVSPATFLPLIPLVLLNGVKGIATGYSTDILPRRLDDLIDATLRAIDGKPVKKMTPFWNRYDFQINELEDKYEVIGKFKRDGTSRVIVTELPPNIDLEGYREHLIELEESDKINDWTDSSTDQINIMVKFKRGSLAEMTDEELIKMLKLRTTRTERIVVLDFDGKPRLYESAELLVQEFVNWRLQWYVPRYERELEVERNRLTYWFSLHACMEAGLSKEFAGFKAKAGLKERITAILTAEEIPVVEENVEKISQLPAYRWTEEGRAEVAVKLQECIARIDDIEDILAKPERRREIYRTEVAALKKFKMET